MIKNIVVIGGGTGSFTVLSGLKNHNANLSAIVSMADDGGSTGVLRNELGVLPPGDVRQCLVALSQSDNLMNKLMNHRFEDGCLKGHNFGNLLLSSLEQITGSFDKAVEKASEILRIKGKVIPVTLQKTNLVAELKNGKKIKGEHLIDTGNINNLKKIYLQPKTSANPNALSAISKANFIVIGPGDLYTSIIPNLLVKKIPESIKKSKAKIVFVCNIMNKAGHTDNFSVCDYVKELEKYLGSPPDFVIFNISEPQKKLINLYKKEGQNIPKADMKEMTKYSQNKKTRFLAGNLMKKNSIKPKKGDALKRSLIRHDSEKLAKLILCLK